MLMNAIIGSHPARRLTMAAAALLLCLMAGCSNYQAGGSRTLGEFTDDVGIQAAVKTALVRDEELNGLAINVEVSRSVVSRRKSVSRS